MEYNDIVYSKQLQKLGFYTHNPEINMIAPLRLGAV